jgi:hypothetical protein
MTMLEDVRAHVTAEMREDLLVLADARRVPLSVVIREALTQYLATQKPAPSVESTTVAVVPPAAPPKRPAARAHPWRQGRHSVAPQHALRSRT